VDAEPAESPRRSPPLEARSANHFTLAFTDYEVLIDFGQAYEDVSAEIVHTRITMTPHGAKTLSGMLEDLLAKYETSVGPINRRSGTREER
jgi:hypothetical protein